MMIEFVDWIMWHIVPTIEAECVVVFSKKDRLEVIEQTQRYLALRWYINYQDNMYEDIFLTIENTEPKAREKEIEEKICRKIADVFATSTFRERLFLYETYPQFFGGASVYIISKKLAYGEHTEEEREELLLAMKPSKRMGLISICHDTFHPPKRNWKRRQNGKTLILRRA